MVNDPLHWILLTASLVTALSVFIALFFISAPYGRYARRGWGPQIPTWLGWLLMESVSAVLMLVMFIVGEAPRTITQLVFLLMWEAHYIHRAFIYPFRLRDKWKPMPAVVSLMGGVFNLANAYLNGRYLFDRSGDRYQADWLTSPQFVIGLVLFVTGFIINRQADTILRGLRREGELDYKIPYGGMYRYISCPNYFGEIVEWTGWAIATRPRPSCGPRAARATPRARARRDRRPPRRSRPASLPGSPRS